MKWEGDAEAALKRIPFSDRRKVKARAEAAAVKAGKETVTLADALHAGGDTIDDAAVEASHGGDGFRLEVCSGGGVCPNRAHRHSGGDSRQLAEQIRTHLEKEAMGDFLRRHVKGPVRAHHAFTVSLSDCPNACSRPQIKDIGIIGAASPVLTDNACIMCGACEGACREGAVSVDVSHETPVIERERCISCGGCIAVCPTGKIEAGVSGYRVMIGGKLGRHPRLASELRGIKDAQTVLCIVEWCVDEYKRLSTRGRRFAQIVADDPDGMLSRLSAECRL